MGAAGQGDDARLECQCRGGPKCGEEEVQEQEMRQVIDSYMSFETIFRLGERNVSDSGVSDEDVETGGLGEEGLRAGADARERVEVEMQEMDLWIGEELGTECVASFRQVSCCQVKCRSGNGKGSGGFNTESTWSSR